MGVFRRIFHSYERLLPLEGRQHYGLQRLVNLVKCGVLRHFHVFACALHEVHEIGNKGGFTLLVQLVHKLPKHDMNHLDCAGVWASIDPTLLNLLH